MSYALAVTIGATRTASAAVDLPHSIPDDETGRGRAVPEPPAPAIALHDTSRLITEATPALALTDSELNYVTARFLARVGDPVPMLGRPDLVAEHVAARVVAAAVDLATAKHGADPATIVAVHPGSWQGHRVAAFARGLTEIGLQPTVLLPRPVAIALRFAERVGLEVGQSIVALDIGTRAAECSVVRRSAIDTFETIGRVHVDTTCGGSAFDDALFSHLPTPPLDNAPVSPAVAAQAWRRALVAAKETLSSAPEVVIAGAPGSPSQRLTRSELDGVHEPVALRIAELVERTLASAGDAVAVVLTGGTAAIPTISLTLSECVAPHVMVDDEPRLAVAAGAGIAAWFLAFEQAIDGADTGEVEDDRPGSVQRFLRRRLDEVPGTIQRTSARMMA